MSPLRAIVVGSGFTGLFIAAELARRGAEVTLVEREGGPDGASSRIAGVIHTGARFAVSSPGLAEICFREWRWWKRNMGELMRVREGYYLHRRDWEGAADYLERWASSMKAIGIPFYEDEGVVEVNERVRADRAFWVPEAAVDVRAALGALLSYAIRLGVRYMPRASIAEARSEGDGYRVTIKAGGGEITASGKVFVAAGHEIPSALAPFGLKVSYRLTRGSHVLVNMKTRFILEKLKPPSVGDLVVPSDGLTYIAPSAVEDLSRPVSDEVSMILGSASEVLDLSGVDVVGALTTYRIAISEPGSAIPFDYVYSTGPLTLAYSTNMTCARRVAAEAIRASGAEGLRGGISENYADLWG